MSGTFDSCSAYGGEVHSNASATPNPIAMDQEARLRELQEDAYRSVLVCFLQGEFELTKELLLTELRQALNISDEKSEELTESVMKGEVQLVRTERELRPEVVSKLLEVTDNLSIFTRPVEGSASNTLSGIPCTCSPSVHDDHVCTHIR